MLSKPCLFLKGFTKKYDIAFSYHNIGRLYAEQKNYPEALRYYTQSLKLAEETGDQEMVWLTHYSLGNAYRDQADCVPRRYIIIASRFVY